MLAAATTIILPYAEAGRPKDCPPTLEALEDMADCPGTTSLGVTRTMDAIPASPPPGTHATTHLAVASLTVPPAVHSAVLPPISLTDLITDTPPSSTPRTV